MPNLEVMVSWGISTTLGPLRGVEYWGDGIVTCCAVMMNIHCFVGSNYPALSRPNHVLTPCLKVLLGDESKP